MPPIAVCSMLALLLAPMGALAKARNMLLYENGTIDVHVTTPCNASIVGSTAACYDESIKAAGVYDLPLDDPRVTYPTDGTPWGIHLTGPGIPDYQTYILSWTSGQPTIGPADQLSNPSTFGMKAIAWLSTTQGESMQGTQYLGSVVTYVRSYNRDPEADYNDNYNSSNSFFNYSYLSPWIQHVVLPQLNGSTTFFYTVGDGKTWSTEQNFTTPPDTYPVRIALTADIGQSVNSSVTRDQVMANKPDVIINVGDISYADIYHPGPPYNVGTGDISNQSRWDSHIQMWTPLWSSVPVMNCAGEHEIEAGDINATISGPSGSFTIDWSYPSNYPFQSYSTRYPTPGTAYSWGDITVAQYYHTIIAGGITLITMNNYIPFDPVSPQYKWALKTFGFVNRTETPWLVVQFHAPPYHSYVNHYKEMVCFMSVYEDLFYAYGVDLVINGHVDAYERTHPIYNYEIDTCGPVYVVVGDGGNVEGPARNFVDEINPETNKTYCEGLTSNGYTPNDVNQTDGELLWGPVMQTQAHSVQCPTIHWERSYSVGNGTTLLLWNDTENLNSTDPLGFCQSSQPLWSAHRDPSFGHATLDFLDDSTVTLQWHRNQDGQAVVADNVTLVRNNNCGSARRRVQRRLAAMRRRQAKARKAARRSLAEGVTDAETHGPARKGRKTAAAAGSAKRRSVFDL